MGEGPRVTARLQVTEVGGGGTEPTPVESWPGFQPADGVPEKLNVQTTSR